MGTYEDAGPDTASFEDRDACMQLHPVSDDHIGIDIHALRQDAVPTDSHTFADLCLVPDPRAIANDGVGRNLGGRVDRYSR